MQVHTGHRTYYRALCQDVRKETIHSPYQPVTFNNKHVTNDDKIVTSFSEQFTTIVPHTSDPTARRVKRQLLRYHPIDHTLSAFTTEQVEKAIKQSNNSIATGPDGLAMLHLKHLGNGGHAILTHLFNLSLQSADIPSIWKRAKLIPKPKAGKPRHLGTSYRPISLLCPSIKVLELLLLLALEGSLRLA